MTSPSLPSNEEIRQILAGRTDVQHESVGIVVGIVTPQGRRSSNPVALGTEDASVR